MTPTKLPPRTKYWGYDYKKQELLRMTGKEWHEYTKRETFKSERGSDSAWGGGVEIYWDETYAKYHGEAPGLDKVSG